MDDVFDSTDIDKAEERSGIILDELQRKAVEGAVENGLFVITGGPGTGKTTVIKNILNVFENKGFPSLLQRQQVRQPSDSVNPQAEKQVQFTGSWALNHRAIT